MKKLLSKFSVELGSLEDAYITSRYAVRDYSPEETEGQKEVVEVVRNAIREVID